MGWSDETENSFPPQRHKEPLGLRQDILDELHDHLAEAAQREVDSGVEQDEDIRENVLTKFGNPATVARALWWDAMKGTIMKDWIQIAVNTILCIGVIAFMSLMYNRMNATNTAMLGALGELTSSTSELQDPTIRFLLRRGDENGPIVSDVPVHVRGSLFNDELETIRGKTDELGTVSFGPIAPGSHRVWVMDPVTGLNLSRSFVAFKGESDKAIEIVLPPDIRTSITTESIFPSSAHLDDMELVAHMEVFWNSGEDAWTSEDFELQRRRPGNSHNVLITADGIFEIDEIFVPRVAGHIDSDGFGNAFLHPINVRDAISSLSGNRIHLSSFHLVRRVSDIQHEKNFTELHRIPSEPEVYEEVFEVTSDGVVDITLQIPDKVAARFHQYQRRALNYENWNSEDGAWLNQFVTSTYIDYTIANAEYITHTPMLVFKEIPADPSDGLKGYGRIDGTSGQLFSLEDIPEQLLDDSRLLFAVPSLVVKSVAPNAVIEAYLDFTPRQYDETPFLNLNGEPTFEFGETPIWTIRAEKLLARFDNGDAHAIDLTDQYRASNGFGNATAILFKWRGDDDNLLVLRGNDKLKYAPVWLTLQPYPPVSNDTRAENTQ